eukprot:6204250-Pleurochrysis_carterae.AAC.3
MYIQELNGEVVLMMAPNKIVTNVQIWTLWQGQLTRKGNLHNVRTYYSYITKHSSGLAAVLRRRVSPCGGRAACSLALTR